MTIFSENLTEFCLLERFCSSILFQLLSTVLISWTTTGVRLFQIREFIMAVSAYTASRVDIIAYSMGSPIARKVKHQYTYTVKPTELESWIVNFCTVWLTQSIAHAYSLLKTKENLESARGYVNSRVWTVAVMHQNYQNQNYQFKPEWLRHMHDQSRKDQNYNWSAARNAHSQKSW